MPKRAPRAVGKGPGASPERLRSAQGLQDIAQEHQEAPKTSPGAPQECPRAAQEQPKSAQESPKSGQEAPKRGPSPPEDGPERRKEGSEVRRKRHSSETSKKPKFFQLSLLAGRLQHGPQKPLKSYEKEAQEGGKMGKI